MKTNTFWRGLLLGLCLGSSAMAAAPSEPARPNPKISVEFVNPEKFTDVSLEGRIGDPGDRDYLLGELRKELEYDADHLLKDGEHLAVRITDVDMAGDYEPWRGIRAEDIRMIRDIYPPRIKLEFIFAGPDGKVVSQGSKVLRNSSFMADLGTVAERDQPMVYEKQLLRDWIHSELKR